MTPARFLLLLTLTLAAACSGAKSKIPVPTPEEAAAKAALWRKIEIDLSVLDENGLRGPADGKVAVSYEFAIANTDACKDRVATIDPGVHFMPGSRGRIGATKDQCLCVGDTSRKDYREVLQALAALPCVERIIECHFE